MIRLLPLALLLSLAFALQSVDAATIRQTLEGGMDVSLSYPDSVISGRSFDLSVFIQNNGWEDKQDVRLVVTSSEDLINAKNSTVTIERLSAGSSYGATMAFTTTPDSQPRTYYLNAYYSQVLLSNNETPNPPTVRNIAIPVVLKGQPQVQLNTVTPSAIFENAEFPFYVEVVSLDVDITNVHVLVLPPDDVMFRGQTTHTFSSIQKGVPVEIHLQMITSPEEVTSEHKIPFEVVLNYVDDQGEEQTVSKTVPLLLRPRTFMEFTTDGGLWIGGFFLAPYVSIGTLVGIPAGALFSILIHRLQKKKSGKKRKTK